MKGILGGRLTVRRQPLELLIGVRIPASQPDLMGSGSTPLMGADPASDHQEQAGPLLVPYAHLPLRRCGFRVASRAETRSSKSEIRVNTASMFGRTSRPVGSLSKRSAIASLNECSLAVKITRLSCHRFRSNEVRLWLSLIAYSLGNLWRRPVLPKRIENWSLTSLQQRLVKTGGRLVKHARYYWLVLAESHLTRWLFGSMACRIAALPVPTG